MHNEGASLHCSIQICNTHRGLIESLQHQWGGNVYDKSAPRQKLRAWVLHLSGEEADRVAMAILPHLIVKREQLEIWMRARLLVQSRGGYRSYRLTEKDQIERYAIVAEMKALRATEGERL
jgi:hypothetical protein